MPPRKPRTEPPTMETCAQDDGVFLLPRSLSQISEVSERSAMTSGRAGEIHRPIAATELPCQWRVSGSKLLDHEKTSPPRMLSRIHPLSRCSKRLPAAHR